METRLFLREGHTVPSTPMPDPVTIRRAYPDDGDELVGLAALDCRRLPAGDLLVAEVDGHLWAALSLDAGEAIADPFRPAAAIVRLLRIRAAQLGAAATVAERDRTWRRQLTPRRQTTG